MVSTRERLLRSRLALFREGAQARVPQGSGPAAAEAQRRSSQRDLPAEVETGTALSLPSLDRFSASSQGWEARTAVSSALIEAQTLQLSDSEELDVLSANARDTEVSPPQSRAYEELVEVVTRAVEKLSIDWPAKREDVHSKGKLTNASCLLVHNLNAGDCGFFGRNWFPIESIVHKHHIIPLY